MLSSGTIAGSGSFSCEGCSYVISLAAADALPECPNCGGNEYARASLFTSELDPAQLQSEPASVEEVDLMAKARTAIDEPGRYIVFMEGDKFSKILIEQELMRIGRSLSADLRFDDPTVSRRHALIDIQGDDIRVLDDRSLNGVFVNGERVECQTLSDGDEIIVGRHQLRFVDTVPQRAVNPDVTSVGQIGT